MALTLRSSTSFLSSLDPTSKLLHKPEDAPPSCVAVPQAPSRLRAIRAAAQAPPTPMEALAPPPAELLHGQVQEAHAGGGEPRRGGVPVYVMLPLDTVGPDGQVLRARALAASLMALRSAGVEGVMVDVWWGVVEREGPGHYDWGSNARPYTLKS